MAPVADGVQDLLGVLGDLHEDTNDLLVEFPGVEDVQAAVPAKREDRGL